METNIKNPQRMGSLDSLLKSQFKEIKEVNPFLDLQRFEIYIDPACNPESPFVKALDAFLGPFVSEHGEVDLPYYFEIHRERELLDILRYNDPESEYHIRMEINGKLQDLRILDVMGATNDYTIFNADFEKIGHFFTEGVAHFVPAEHWQTNDPQLKPYLDEIIRRMGEQIGTESEVMEVDVNDPDDVDFWAEQFEITAPELMRAVRTAGKSIDAITQYLQK